MLTTQKRTAHHARYMFPADVKTSCKYTCPFIFMFFSSAHKTVVN